MPKSHLTRRLFLGLLALALVTATTSSAVIRPAPADASTEPAFYNLANANLRFGSGEPCRAGCDDFITSSINLDSGTLARPFYFNGDKWFPLTYSSSSAPPADQYPLDIAVGWGDEGDSATRWHRNPSANLKVSDDSSWSNAAFGLEISPVGFTTTRTVTAADIPALAPTGSVGAVRGFGELESQISVAASSSAKTDGDATLLITQNYSLGQTASFVRIRTTVTNVSGAPVENVNLWVGTRDDWIGTQDRPNKIRGTLTGGDFVPATSRTVPSNAMQIRSGDEGVLFYSTSLGATTVWDSCCDFINVVNQDPFDPDRPIESGSADGSYGIYLPVGELAAGGSRSIVWFYAAGEVETLGAVAEAVQVAAEIEDSGTTPPTDSPIAESVAVAVQSASELTGTDGVVVRRNVPVPLVSTTVPTVGPRGGLVLEDDEGTLKVTISTAAGVSPTAGVVVPTDGEIVCEVCARLAAGSVVEAWVLSDPRLAAAVRVEVDAEEGTCPLLRIPVGTPLDGGGAIEPGAHTLQLRMYTENGFEVLAVPITIGGIVPTSVPSGEGPGAPVDLLLLAGLALAALGAVATRRRTRTTGTI